MSSTVVDTKDQSIGHTLPGRVFAGFIIMLLGLVFFIASAQGIQDAKGNLNSDSIDAILWFVSGVLVAYFLAYFYEYAEDLRDQATKTGGSFINDLIQPLTKEASDQNAMVAERERTFFQRLKFWTTKLVGAMFLIVKRVLDFVVARGLIISLNAVIPWYLFYKSNTVGGNWLLTTIGHIGGKNDVLSIWMGIFVLGFGIMWPYLKRIFKNSSGEFDKLMGVVTAVLTILGSQTIVNVPPTETDVVVKKIEGIANSLDKLPSSLKSQLSAPLEVVCQNCGDGTQQVLKAIKETHSLISKNENTIIDTKTFMQENIARIGNNSLDASELGSTIYSAVYESAQLSPLPAVVVNDPTLFVAKCLMTQMEVLRGEMQNTQYTTEMLLDLEEIREQKNMFERLITVIGGNKETRKETPEKDEGPHEELRSINFSELEELLLSTCKDIQPSLKNNQSYASKAAINNGEPLASANN